MPLISAKRNKNFGDFYITYVSLNVINYLRLFYLSNNLIYDRIQKNIYKKNLIVNKYLKFKSITNKKNIKKNLYFFFFYSLILYYIKYNLLFILIK